MGSSGNSLTSAEQQALLWPIQAKGAVTRLQPLNDPSISQFYSNSMEEGRFLEASLADANTWLLQKMQLVKAYITSYTHMNSLAVDGQLGDQTRPPKFVIDSISILQTAQQLQQELVGLVQAIQNNLTQLEAIESSLLTMVQANLNSLANLLNNICNWGLPGLPSMPNIFPDQLWNWNGFLFSPLALFSIAKSITTFNFNFTFSQCSIGPTSTTVPSIFTNNPITQTNYSGLTFGSATYYTPPFDGEVVPSSQNQQDPSFIATMQANTTDPVYQNTFNPLENMWGAMPDPHFIISNWQPSADTLDTDIVSIVPALRNNTIFTIDPDYSNPNFAIRDLQLRKDLIHFVNLQNIVASNFDPLLTAAWLIYLNLDRAGRGGVWIPNFQTVYTNYIQPSVSIVTTIAVPWNDVLGENNYFWMSTWNSTTAYEFNDVVTYNGTAFAALLANTNIPPGSDNTTWGIAPANVIYSNAPVIPLLQTFASLTPTQLNHLLWQLSYVEASLLGYSRSATWDQYQDNTYLTGATGSDLDYEPTAISTQNTSLTLGVGTAEFPVTITFPTSFKTTMDAVIIIATADIQADLTYLSPRLGNRYTYNQFAIATQVDRYSQFWRDFASNLTVFLAQDPYLVQFAATYSEILNGAINPLGSATAYNSLVADVASRNRSWTPGTPLLNIPIQPITIPPSSSVPDLSSSGWTNNMTFNPTAFLARPDIQALPIPTQIAMLRTNLSYAGVNTWKSQMQASIATQIATCNSLITSTQTTGFHVSVYTTTTPVPHGVNAQVNFDALQLPADFDVTGNVTTLQPGLFTIQEAGTYNGIGTFMWTVPAAGTYTITVLDGGTPIATASSTTTGAGTITTSVSFTQAINLDDMITVLASTNLASGTATIEPGSTFSMVLVPTSGGGGNTPTGQGNTRNYNLDVPYWITPPVALLTAVSIDDNGNATPLDPSVPAVTMVQVVTNMLTITANNHFNVGDLVTFSGFQNASFLNGQVVTIATLVGTAPTYTAFTASFTNANYGPTAEVQPASVLYAINSSGAVLFPNPDGVMLTSGSQGDSVTVTTYYGEQYIATPVTAADQITVGGLLFVGLDGRLTQDYASLTTGTPNTFNQGPVGWIICIGRVSAYDAGTQTLSFIYEPHIPTRFSSMI